MTESKTPPPLRKKGLREGNEEQSLTKCLTAIAFSSDDHFQPFPCDLEHHGGGNTPSWNYKIWTLICFDVPRHQNFCPGAMTRYKKLSL